VKREFFILFHIFSEKSGKNLFFRKHPIFNAAYFCKNVLFRRENVEFPTFAALKHHYGQVHKVSFCHICCDHLNILPKNRVTYTNEDLQKHMNGELNEYGFKGRFLKIIHFLFIFLSWILIFSPYKYLELL
jgi:hypothetical protein